MRYLFKDQFLDDLGIYNDHLTTRVYEIYKNGIRMKYPLNMFRCLDVERH